MGNFAKKVKIGRTEYGLLTAEIKYTNGRLSICGYEGKHHCGQIIMSEWRMRDYAPGWTPELVAAFREIWGTWHLNDAQAGSPAQMEYLRGKNLRYEQACEELAAAGLNPDPDYLYDGKPYRYGSAWLFKSVPEAVLQFLKDLP